MTSQKNPPGLVEEDEAGSENGGGWWCGHFHTMIDGETPTFFLLSHSDPGRVVRPSMLQASSFGPQVQQDSLAF